MSTAESDPTSQWVEIIDDAKLVLADDVEPADLAAEFGTINDALADDLCMEAVMQVDYNRSAVTLDDFRAAWEVVTDDREEGTDEPTAEESGADELQQLKAEVESAGSTPVSR